MKWIKIKDRLPDKEGFYIVRQKGGYVTQLKFRPDVKLKEDDIWTFNILSEWLDETPLPVTGESEAIGELLEALQGLVNDVKNKPNDTRYATHIKIAESVISKYKQSKK